MPDTPNILLITTDQQRWDTVGAYGVAPVKTPNLDALAAQGVLCDRAYCANPLCMPSRTSILTAQYPSRHGVYTNGVAADEDYNASIGRVLGELGYATTLVGKAHFRPCSNGASLESPPQVYDLDFYRNWSGPYYGFDHVELAICHSHEAPACGMHYGAWLADRGVDTMHYWGRPDQAYTSVGPWDLPEEHHNSRWVADRTIAAVERATSAKQPFFVWASFQDPHNPVVVPEPWYSLHDRATVPDYGLRENEMRDKPPFYEEFLEHGTFDEGRVTAGGIDSWPCLGRQLTRNEAIPQDYAGMDREANRRNAVAAYYGMVSLADHHVGRMVADLKAHGLFENTLIVFTSDHGEYLGNHGVWWKGLPAYEDCHRVPLLACWPRAIPPGQRSHALHSLIDLGPTFAAAAGGRRGSDWQGKNQLEVWRGRRESARDHALIEFRPTDSDFQQLTVVTANHKLVAYPGRDWGELYDLGADPDQVRNLWTRQEAANLRRRLEIILAHSREKERERRPRVAPA